MFCPPHLTPQAKDAIKPAQAASLALVSSYDFPSIGPPQKVARASCLGFHFTRFLCPPHIIHTHCCVSPTVPPASSCGVTQAVVDLM